jgi:hypothetical protein
MGEEPQSRLSSVRQPLNIALDDLAHRLRRYDYGVRVYAGSPVEIVDVVSLSKSCHAQRPCPMAEDGAKPAPRRCRVRDAGRSVRKPSEMSTGCVPCGTGRPFPRGRITHARLTQPPRLVATVTSGEVVTMRRANSVSSLPMSFMSRPKPCCVESCRLDGTAKVAGTGMAGASQRRRPSALKGTADRNDRNRSAGMPRPSNFPQTAVAPCVEAGKSVSSWSSLQRGSI